MAQWFRRSTLESATRIRSTHGPLHMGCCRFQTCISKSIVLEFLAHLCVMSHGFIRFMTSTLIKLLLGFQDLFMNKTFFGEVWCFPTKSSYNLW